MTDDRAKKVDRTRFLVGDAAKDTKCHLCRKRITTGDRVAMTFGVSNNIYCLRCANK